MCSTRETSIGTFQRTASCVLQPVRAWKWLLEMFPNLKGGWRRGVGRSTTETAAAPDRMYLILLGVGKAVKCTHYHRI